MDASFSSDNNDENASPYPISAVSLSKKEKEAVSVLLNDLPLTRSPFKDLCRKISSLSGNELLLIAQNLKLKKILKRYSAVLHHYNTAFICNALTAWRLDFQNMHRVRKAFNIGSMVSHLYIRDTIPGKWEYPLFAMIHAKNKEELADFINAIVRNTGCHDYLVLSTVKELKKERIHYFSE
jgi:siroheme decarboxylase